MKGLPLVVSDFLVTGLVAIAAIVVVKTIVLSTPLSGINGLHRIVSFV